MATQRIDGSFIMNLSIPLRLILAFVIAFSSFTSLVFTNVRAANEPVISNLTLVQSPDGAGSWTSVAGSQAAGYHLSLNGVAGDFTYLNVGTFSLSHGPLTVAYHPFYLNKDAGNLPPDYDSYWDARGVNSSATAPSWQYYMWQIINGTEPIFYLNYDGSNYYLVDGLVHNMGQPDEYLRIDGDYPTWKYKFDGTITASGGSTNMSVYLTVNNVPGCSGVTLDTNEDSAGDTAPSCTDADGDTLTYSIVGAAAHGTASVVSGNLHYVPNSNYYGGDSFTYRAYDGVEYSDAASVTVTVAPVNDAPVVSGIPDQLINEGATFTTIALDNYVTDVDNADADMVWTHSVTSSLTVDITNRVATITFAGGWTGSETITFRATDPGSQYSEDAAEFSVNDAPVVSDIPDQTLAEGATFATISLDNYVSDTDDADNEMVWTYSGNTNLTVSIVNRVATISPPDANWNGAETIIFRATDPGGLYAENAATFTLTAVNDVPVAVADSYSVLQNGTLNAPAPGVLSNDTDADVPHTLTAIKVTDPSHGNVTLNSNGSFTYTPTALYVGPDSFTYKANDGTADSNTATVSISVDDTNLAPTDISLTNSSVAENSAINTVVGALSTTDPDPGNTFTYILVDNAGYPDNTSFNIDGSNLRTSAIFNYETKASYTIKVRTTDQDALFYEEVFTISVTNVNEAPTDITLTPTTVAENLPINSVVGALTTTDPDAGDTFTYSLVAGTGDTDNAQFNISGSNLQTSASFDYETKASYSIRVRSTDQGGILFFEKSFTITVTNANDPPVIDQGDSVGVVMGEDNVPPFALTLTASDQDANTLTWSIQTQAAHGHASVSGTGTSKAVTYTADANYNGSVFFVVLVTDGAGGSDTITVNVTITPDLGDIYYVDQATGNDLDDGLTPLNAFQTLAKGASKVRPGDTVMVLAGTFAETVKPSFSGLAGYPVTFTAQPGVIVTGEAGNADTGGAFRLSGFSYIVINGFTIQNTADYGIYALNSSYLTITNNRVTSAGTPGSANRFGIYLLTTTNSIISGNTVDHNSDNGIELLNGSNFNVVSDNISYANAKETVSQATGIECRNSSNNTVIHNIVYANEDSGLNFYAGAASNAVIGNLSYGNGDHGIDHNTAPNNIIVGNTVHGNVTSGINLEASSSGATLANNIAVDNGLRLQVGGGTVPGTKPGNIYVDSTSTSGTTMNYDLVYQSTGTGLVQIAWGSTTYTSLAAFKAAHPTLEVNGLEANPLLQSPAAIAQRPAGAPYNVAVNIGDYHILTGSPAIDSANSNAPNEPELDITGHSRYDDPATTNTGAGVRLYDDRGAYEFQPPLTFYAVSVIKSGTGTGTVTSSPAGINCGADCSELFSYGLSVTLSAAVADGYNRFTGWSGTGINCPGTGTCQVIVSDIKTVTATFEKTTFSDVPYTHPRWGYIQSLWDNHLTAGCATTPTLQYCPDQTMLREQSAVFMLRGEFGDSYTPPVATGTIFADMTDPAYWATKWAEGMWEEEMTAGCATNPLQFCPLTQFTREQGAVFALNMKYGVSYTPPPGTGLVFADMTNPTYWGTKWAEKAYADGLIPACGESGGKPLFCPSQQMDRSWSAYIIVNAKGLTLPQ